MQLNQYHFNHKINLTVPFVNNSRIEISTSNIFEYYCCSYNFSKCKSTKNSLEIRYTNIGIVLRLRIMYINAIIDTQGDSAQNDI